MPRTFAIKQLTKADIELMEPLLDMFGKAFDEEDVYGVARPRPAYFERLLSSEYFIALVALLDGEIAGGIAAYELQKFEQERSEIYIYDLAVALEYRRRGVATTLIEALKQIAFSRGAYLVFVQADCGDDPAISLYSKLGIGKEVLHFDIATGHKKRGA